jgi:hypothetical protein
MATTGDDGSSGPGGGWVIPKWIGWTLVGLPVAGALAVFLSIAAVGVPYLYRSMTPDGSGLLPEAAREMSSALKEHQAIVRVAEMCAGGVEESRKAVRAEPFVPLDIHHPLSESVAVQDGSVAPPLPGYLEAVLYLSNAIAIARAQMAGTAVHDRLISEVFEWTIVATGLFTTILISIKSFASPRSSGYVSMAVMAIVLSSLGTAVATLNSFYTPRLVYDKTERSLASLRSLHWTLAGELLREKGACESKGNWTDWRPRHVRDLTNTFVAIMGASAKPTAAAEDGQDAPNLNDAPRHSPGAAPTNASADTRASP